MSSFSHVRSQKIDDDYVIVDARIIQDQRLSLEGKGYYGCLCAESIDLKDVPNKIIEELIDVGFLKKDE